MGHHGRDLLRALFGSRHHGHHGHHGHHDDHHDYHDDYHHGHHEYRGDHYAGRPYDSGPPPPYRAPYPPTRRAPAALGGVDCASCGASNTPDARFCAACGGQLAQPTAAACARCDAGLPAGAKFCAACGAAVA